MIAGYQAASEEPNINPVNGRTHDAAQHSMAPWQSMWSCIGFDYHAIDLAD